MKGMYSNNTIWISSWKDIDKPFQIVKGLIKDNAQKVDILP